MKKSQMLKLKKINENILIKLFLKVWINDFFNEH